ncbi:hypothetical protein L6R53_10045 [Myxococcota bacterium]|nr:hypothetical protein [Myxococcota bacterium]
MTRSAATLALAASVLALAAWRRGQPPPPPVVVDLLAPPLARVEALGDRTLASSPAGRPLARPPASAPAAPPPAVVQGHALRLRLEGHGLAIAEVLGPERVAWGLARREDLSAQHAETAAWRDLVVTLQGP